MEPIFANRFHLFLTLHFSSRVACFVYSVLFPCVPPNVQALASERINYQIRQECSLSLCETPSRGVGRNPSRSLRVYQHAFRFRHFKPKLLEVEIFN